MPPIDDLPGTLIIPGRDDIRAQYLRDVRIRTPGANTNDGTLEAADADVFADQMVPVYFDVKNIGDYVANKNKTGAALDAELERAGTRRLPPAGGFGYVIISASSAGGKIFAGDEIKDEVTQLRFQCTQEGFYTDGQAVPIVGIDTGPETNLDAGTKMRWTFPRPGIGPNATVFEQTDGDGLSGGRNEETDEEANRRLEELRQNPAAAGNDAAIQLAAYDTPGVAIQQVFTYPAIRGAGTIGVTYTLRPGTPGSSRAPTPLQLGATQAYLTGIFPADDGILMCILIEYPITLVFAATWAQQAASWYDAVTWPAYNAASPVQVSSATTPTTTSFRLTTTVSSTAPVVGQTIAFYDQPNATFRKKRISAVSVVSAGLTWDITVDQTNDSSDLSYTPVAGQYAMPWSESLQSIVPDVVDYFDNVGPGEQVSTFVDPNLRQHRTPRSPNKYGNTITNRLISPLFEVSAVDDIELMSPNVPYATPTGAAGIASFLLTLGDIAVFPQT